MQRFTSVGNKVMPKIYSYNYTFVHTLLNKSKKVSIAQIIDSVISLDLILSIYRP